MTNKKYTIISFSALDLYEICYTAYIAEQEGLTVLPTKLVESLKELFDREDIPETPNYLKGNLKVGIEEI